MVLAIRSFCLEEIVRHSSDMFPIEACGILVGRKGDHRKIVEKAYRTKNVLNSASGYQIDPADLARVFAYAENDALEVVGFYHSHPYWSAQVSEVDRSFAHYPGLSYVIYSIPDNEVRSFQCLAGDFDPESVEVF